MAANPLPKPPAKREVTTPPVLIVNAATVINVNALQGQPIEWENSTPNDIHISVQASGVYPLQENDFTVKGTNGPIQAKPNGVLPNCPVNSYTFTRGAALGGGKIIVSGNVPNKR
jgi:hypothetical protein